MADGADAFIRKMGQFQKAFEGPKVKELLHAIGKMAKDSSDKALQADLGDQSMSNWRRGNPIDLTVSYKLESDTEVLVQPARRAAGPWRVLEEGRKAGGAYDLVQVGRARKDGTRRGKSRGRNQGATAAKNTWTEAVAIMAEEAPVNVNGHITHHATRAFGS